MRRFFVLFCFHVYTCIHAQLLDTLVSLRPPPVAIVVHDMLHSCQHPADVQTRIVHAIRTAVQQRSWPVPVLLSSFPRVVRNFACKFSARGLFCICTFHVPYTAGCSCTPYVLFLLRLFNCLIAHVRTYAHTYNRPQRLEWMLHWMDSIFLTDNKTMLLS